MIRSAVMVLFVSVIFVASISGAASEAITPKETIQLFNGKDLTPFYSYLRGYGKNNDPKKVFTVHDGMIHVSGEVDGGLITEKEYQNYRLVVEFKWGDKTWPPREGRAMDSGIFLHCTGEDGAAGGAWPEAFEFQVWQGAVGDFILIPGKGKRSLTVEGEQRGRLFYHKPGAAAQTRQAAGTLSMVAWYGRDLEWKNVKGYRGRNDVEKPHGEWNHVEAVCQGDSITNIVNGKVVNKGTKASHSSGRILLQSEGAEIYFRKVELQPVQASANPK